MAKLNIMQDICDLISDFFCLFLFKSAMQTAANLGGRVWEQVKTSCHIIFPR